MPNDGLQKQVLNVLKDLPEQHSTEPLKKLFWENLNYNRADQSFSKAEWSDKARNALTDNPVLFATAGEQDSFHIIYCQLVSDKLPYGKERLVISQLLKEHPYSLFIFSNEQQNLWHFLNVKYDEKTEKRRLFRRITIGKYERLRTASERLSLLDTDSIDRDLFGLSPVAIQNRHDEAFDVEAVTKKFFTEYSGIFSKLQSQLQKQTNDNRWAHDYALQFLNRLMFLYFIQRKRWLGDDTEFIRSYWKAYKRSNQPVNSFFDKWLKVLFFEAFNGQSTAYHKHFPDELKRAFIYAPYLNGGLFTVNELDRNQTFNISDAQFEEIFDLLESYNFTIAEDSPIDKEVAVDPEMIGKVYESLVNVSSELDERGDAGIFYTARTEIDLMCRLALVDNLANHLGTEHKNTLYELVFALDDQDKENADNQIASVNLWQAIYAQLSETTILDPACGSGSFLVGMLYILNDLLARAGRQLNKVESDFERKKKIIGQSLYGVDVMEWACHVAELRLWLALIIDADFTEDQLYQLQVQGIPLLPYFTFKIRPGDSLVQELGGIDLSRIRESKLPAATKSKVTQLRNEKLKFYNNAPNRKYKTEGVLKHQETLLFRGIIDDLIHDNDNQRKQLRTLIGNAPGGQKGLKGIADFPEQENFEVKAWRKQIEMLNLDYGFLSNARNSLNEIELPPFMWDISFAEIFSDDQHGFDVVIGNPPYVRQEQIADPMLCRTEVNVVNKKEYKSKLARSVYMKYPWFFGTNPDLPTYKLNAQSDLYLYYYLHALSLLCPKGTFCFITSNSWLDVGYGKDLQEFLIEHCQIKYIIDNKVKRSFKDADVNTIIALFSAPMKKKGFHYDNISRFINFTVPFEHIIDPIIFEEIEETDQRKSTPEYKIHPIKQIDLRKSGLEKAPAIKVPKYIGDKWGGKYLRAPDIYWTILEKGKGKLVRLGDIAEVRFGIKTGANEFFYLDQAKIDEWGIEEEFLKPVIKSPRECKRILIDPNDLKFKIFMCHKDKKELKGMAALEYIKWGENEGFNDRPSCRGRKRWWEIGEKTANSLFVKEANDTSAVFFNQHELPVDCRLYCANLPLFTFYYLNSGIGAMMFEIYNRAGLGEGARSLMVDDYNLIPSIGDACTTNASNSIFENLKKLKPRKLKEKNNLEWKELDEIVFDFIGLSNSERDGVCEAVIDLVEARLNKAGSLNK